METKIEQLKELKLKAEKSGNTRLKESLEKRIKLLSNANAVRK